MRIPSRCITLGAAAGLLALGAASVLAAQQQQPRDTMQTGAVTQTDTLSQRGMATDTGKAGIGADTALKAKPGLQTGRARGDTGTAGTTDTMTMPSKTIRKKGAKGYHHTGAPSDTALHARPGTQTGKTSADSGKMKHGHHGAMADSASARPDSMR
jgi:hypothetical protein